MKYYSSPRHHKRTVKCNPANHNERLKGGRGEGGGQVTCAAVICRDRSLVVLYFRNKRFVLNPSYFVFVLNGITNDL